MCVYICICIYIYIYIYIEREREREIRIFCRVACVGSPAEQSTSTRETSLAQ